MLFTCGYRDSNQALFTFELCNWSHTSLRDRESILKLTVRQWILTPAAAENPLGAQRWSRKHFLIQIFWQEPCGTPSNDSKVCYPTLLKENRYRVRGKCDYNCSEEPFLLCWRSIHFFFFFIFSSLPRLLLMSFKFSTQLVFTAAKCPTKPADFWESASVEQLGSLSWCHF